MYPELTQLRIRKQKLLAQSESNRTQLAAAVEDLRGPVSTMERGISFFRETRFLWMLAAPVAGFFVAKKWRTLGSISTTLVSSLGLIRNCFAIWQGFKHARSSPDQDS